MSLEVFGDDGNPPEHGRDTAVYQELQVVRNKLDSWLARNKSDLPNEELADKAQQAVDLLHEISDELDAPL